MCLVLTAIELRDFPKPCTSVGTDDAPRSTYIPTSLFIRTEWRLLATLRTAQGTPAGCRARNHILPGCTPGPHEEDALHEHLTPLPGDSHTRQACTTRPHDENTMGECITEKILLRRWYEDTLISTIDAGLFAGPASNSATDIPRGKPHLVVCSSAKHRQAAGDYPWSFGLRAEHRQIQVTTPRPHNGGAETNTTSSL